LILAAASRLYGAAASWRRGWYAHQPGRVRRLRQPVISVGNLTVGGSGKTPVVAAIARLLIESGERPAILIRGYARRSFRDGVTVVSDRSRVLATVDPAGDEALMLARALPGVPVMVGANRFLSGRLAEARFDATVHLLDDGFQHFGLGREIDLLLVDEQVLNDRVVPSGRLREPLAAAAVADAVLVAVHMPSPTGTIALDSLSLARELGVSVAFSVGRRIEEPTLDLRGVPVFAVAGIARPERFFADLVGAGWSVAGTLAFRDHHAYTSRDVARIALQARGADAEVIVTTEKDAVRFEALDIGPLRLRPIALRVGIEPAAAFHEWLLQRVRAAHATAAGRAPHLIDRLQLHAPMHPAP
jgi:tetraacyldisaccharide 4'-kinase